MSYLKLCALVLILAATISCGEQPYFMETISFDGQKWTQNIMPEFKVNFEGDTSSYDVIFTFRTSTDYAYNNLWIYLTTAGPICPSISENTAFFGRKAKELKIAKPNGEWLGQKSGTFIENKLYYIRSKFCKGTYTFKLEQGITIKEMQNISDVTIEVKPTY